VCAGWRLALAWPWNGARRQVKAAGIAGSLTPMIVMMAHADLGGGRCGFVDSILVTMLVRVWQ
jgi:hypothetical protein